jgi:hypothetical protein
MQGQRALIKDPFALFSAPWFAERLNCNVVITVRHPAGFASSLKRLGWNYDFRNLLDQPLLMRDHLEADRAAMESMPHDDIIGQGALLWKFIYRFVHSTREPVPALQHCPPRRPFPRPHRRLPDFVSIPRLGFYRTGRDIISKFQQFRKPAKLAKNKTHSVKLDSRANLDNWKKLLSPEEIRPHP